MWQPSLCCPAKSQKQRRRSDAAGGAQVSVYDTINPDGNYCRKVRLLGSFHPQLAVRVGPDAADIDDPLYGNVGGAAEQVLSSLMLIHLSPAAFHDDDPLGLTNLPCAASSSTWVECFCPA